MKCGARTPARRVDTLSTLGPLQKRCRQEWRPSTQEWSACATLPTVSLQLMEVHFTPEQETELSRIAKVTGTDTERLVRDAALRLVEQDRRFRAAVREGIAQADRGEFIEEEEMDARLEKLLRS